MNLQNVKTAVEVSKNGRLQAPFWMDGEMVCFMIPDEDIRKFNLRNGHYITASVFDPQDQFCHVVGYDA